VADDAGNGAVPASPEASAGAGRPSLTIVGGVADVFVAATGPVAAADSAPCGEDCIGRGAGARVVVSEGTIAGTAVAVGAAEGCTAGALR